MVIGDGKEDNDVKDESVVQNNGTMLAEELILNGTALIRLLFNQEKIEARYEILFH